jgi:glycosyltransferase involved in cell wall biosynthesis
MWNDQTVSVVLPTYTERETIRACIDGFVATGYVDEVIVVNNNAEPGTSAEIALTGAREVMETTQGYGAAIQRGLTEAAGDLILICEPDDTFEPKDILKLLAYSADFDFVLGSRTAKELIWDGANMGLFLKWGNFAVAKLIEVLFNTATLTDVGCTLRLIKRDACRRMQPYFTIKAGHFSPEMMLIACVLDISLVQIPVNYRSRMGVSTITGTNWKAFRVGLQMIKLILAYKWRHDHFRLVRRRLRKRKPSESFASMESMR